MRWTDEHSRREHRIFTIPGPSIRGSHDALEIRTPKTEPRAAAAESGDVLMLTGANTAKRNRKNKVERDLWLRFALTCLGVFVFYPPSNTC
jgi:hypothetical protein